MPSLTIESIALDNLDPFDTPDVLQRSLTYNPDAVPFHHLYRHRVEDNIPEKCLTQQLNLPFQKITTPTNWPHNLSDHKSFPDNNELTGFNFNSNIMLLNATPNAHDLSIVTVSEVRAKYNCSNSVIYRLISGNYQSSEKVPLNLIGNFSEKSPIPIGNFPTYSKLLNAFMPIGPNLHQVYKVPCVTS